MKLWKIIKFIVVTVISLVASGITWYYLLNGEPNPYTMYTVPMSFLAIYLWLDFLITGGEVS